jgi:hypothetical protein
VKSIYLYFTILIHLISGLITEVAFSERGLIRGGLLYCYNNDFLKCQKKVIGFAVSEEKIKM